MPATLTAPNPEVPEGEDRIILSGIAWEQYVAIGDALPERRGLRLIYLDGSLTLLTLSRRHDWFVDYLDMIVKAVALGFGVPIEFAGSATFRLKRKKAGVQGDRTYYFGAHAVIMRGPVNIDLAIQPPPDLAVEVEVTHPADEAIAIYARLGVPEVWRIDPRRGTVGILVLGEDGSYQSSPLSRGLPMLGAADILAQLRLAEEAESFAHWYAQLNDWVRDLLMPRMAEGE